MHQELFDFSPEVKNAIQNNLPIVALESTVISHGLPYPDNIETAQAMEKVIRDNAAVPATIAILGGKIKIGLTESELQHLATKKSILKVSRRNVSAVVAKKQDGATTVAATMMIAHMANIPVFATGGIGGVHRCVEESFDISADLIEFNYSKVLVVCSGVKSILDIGKTLEVLETNAVPVMAYQQSTFPAFYSRESSFTADLCVNSIEEIREIILTHWRLGGHGCLLANPVPQSAALDMQEVEAWLNPALTAAKKQNITGKAVTPFLLQHLKELSSGKTLQANKALLIANANLAAKIAAYPHLLQKTKYKLDSFVS